jgi:hypothetical protein
MRVMYLPKLNVPDSLDFAVGLYASRIRTALHVPLKASPLLIAYLAWPNDEQKRNSWAATIIARTQNERGSDSTSIFESLGGFKAVAEPAFDALATELTAILNKWTPVADIFLRIVDMADDPRLQSRGGPSISKAIDLCDYENEGYSRGHLRRLWGQFREVAHLLAAGAILAGSVSEGRFGQSILSSVWLAPDSVVGIAAGFQMFGLNLTPHGWKGPVLPTDTVWRLPPECFPPAPFLVKRRLSESHVDFLNERRTTKSQILKPASLA